MLVKPLVNLLMLCMCGCVCAEVGRREDAYQEGTWGFTEGLMFPVELGWWRSQLSSAEQLADAEPGSHQLPALISGHRAGGCPEPISCCCSPWCNIISGRSHSLWLLKSRGKTTELGWKRPKTIKSH